MNINATIATKISAPCGESSSDSSVSMPSLFPPSQPAGHGTAYLSSSPSRFRDLAYTYPLKLISPEPLNNVHTLYLLNYGGGLVAGDSITLALTLESNTKLILLTQGSTKIFKTPSFEIISSQRMEVYLHTDAALCYLPDPVQPFRDSAFEQAQIYYLEGQNASLCASDWVSGGRTARGEMWDFWRYGSRNEVWSAKDQNGKRRLLLRDNILLDRRKEFGVKDVAARVDGLGVICSLILCGPIFDKLAKFFIKEFGEMPRVGEKKWDNEEDIAPSVHSYQGRLQMRRNQEQLDGVLWTVAKLRNFVLVKIGAREVEGARKWLRAMIQEDGTVEQEFGERSLLCLA